MLTHKLDACAFIVKVLSQIFVICNVNISNFQLLCPISYIFSLIEDYFMMSSNMLVVGAQACAYTQRHLGYAVYTLRLVFREMFVSS